MTGFGAAWAVSGTMNKEGTSTAKKKMHLNFTGTKFRAFCFLYKRSYIARPSGCFQTRPVLATGGAIMALPDYLLMQRPQKCDDNALETVLTRRIVFNNVTNRRREGSRMKW
jgi:hypothetical protein